MDKIQKALHKLQARERIQAKAALRKIYARDLDGLNIVKLKGRQDIYRVRIGSVRIIFFVRPEGAIFILTIERRSDTTYSF